MSDSSPSSRAGSHTVAGVQRQTKWVAELVKLKVCQLDALLHEKGRTPTGLKAEKAEQMAWFYTREVIQTWRETQEETRPPPAQQEQPEPGQKNIRDFFRRL